MRNPLDRDFTFSQLLRFALPTVGMMLFTSLYTIVDGICISQLVGENALAASNIVYPVLCALLAAGIMLGSGGGALVGRRLGAGDEEEARKDFTFLALTAVAIGLGFALPGIFGAKGVSRLLGSSDLLLADCTVYLRWQMIFAPTAMLQMLFQTFFVTAGRPVLGLCLTLAGGMTNAVLDVVFMGVLKLGILGAALGTATGQLIPAVVGLLFFSRRKQGLRFARTGLRWRTLLQSCSNGASEMVSNLSGAVTTFLFNAIMMDLLGENGVAAITIVLYAQFLLIALYLGFSMGVAPLISVSYGAENYARLARLFRQCLLVILFSSAMVFSASLLLARPVVEVFSAEGSAVYALALDGFRKFAPSFLFAGINLFASAFFTALSDGRTSAIISFARTFGFQVAGLLILPLLLKVDGVWMAVPFAEAMCVLCSVFFLLRGRKKYHYAG